MVGTLNLFIDLNVITLRLRLAEFYYKNNLRSRIDNKFVSECTTYFFKKKFTSVYLQIKTQYDYICVLVNEFSFLHNVTLQSITMLITYFTKPVEYYE